jgi:ubiquinone biosynthesis protein
MDPEVVSDRMVEFMLKQVFDYGVFHNDPHAGNVLVTDGNVVALLDFGQVARMDSANRELLAEFVLAIVDQDAERLVRAFEAEEILTEQTDRRRLSREVEELLDVYHSMPIGEIPFSRVATQTFELVRNNRLTPPPAFTLMLKALMTVESLSRGLGVRTRLIEYLKPYARRLSIEQLNPLRALRAAAGSVKETSRLLGRLPGDVSAIVGKFRQGKFQLRIHHEHLENLTRVMDKSSNRISFALIIAGLLIASSMLVSQEGFVLGFIRMQTLGVVGYIFAAVLGLWVVASIIRSRHF